MFFVEKVKFFGGESHFLGGSINYVPGGGGQERLVSLHRSSERETYGIKTTKTDITLATGSIR